MVRLNVGGLFRTGRGARRGRGSRFGRRSGAGGSSSAFKPTNYRRPQIMKSLYSPLPAQMRLTLPFKSVFVTSTAAVGEGYGIVPIDPLNFSPVNGGAIDIYTNHFFNLHRIYSRSQCVSAKVKVSIMVEQANDGGGAVLSANNNPIVDLHTAVMSFQQYSVIIANMNAATLRQVTTAPGAQLKQLAPTNGFPFVINHSISLAKWSAQQGAPTVAVPEPANDVNQTLTNTSSLDDDGDVIFNPCVALNRPVIPFFFDSSINAQRVAIRMQVEIWQDWCFTHQLPGIRSARWV